MRDGQVLLVIIMVLATALTIALAVSFKSTTDTQLSKLEEESQRALAAAEGGIEAALREGSLTDFSSLNMTGISGSAVVDTSYNKPEFLTPPLKKDQQFTFYLTQYDKNTNNFTGSYGGSDIFVYFGQGNCPAVEFLVVNTDGSVFRRYLANPTNATPNPCTSDVEGSDDEMTVRSGSYTVEGETFDFRARLESADLAGGNLLFARVLSKSTFTMPLGFGMQNGNIPVQGTTITSQATTVTGVTKRVRLFQSYPQIPAEFFVTQF